ncbi:MAG: hypothetical protein KBA33_08285 [Cloacibacterium sp.]|nr:hypothetical protein [Cloacibacterium sp.]
MKTVQITEDVVLKAHSEASPKGRTLLENLFSDSVFKKDIKERVKTFADVLMETGNDESIFNEDCEGLPKDEIAYRKLKLITKALNEDWTPDWSNGKWDKWFPWFDFDDSSSAGRFSFVGAGGQSSDSGVGSRLCFKSQELATYAGTQFEGLYRDCFVIE